MTENVNKAGLAQLKSAIIGSAMNDYVLTYITLSHYIKRNGSNPSTLKRYRIRLLQRDIDSAEAFFNSEWFKDLAYGIVSRDWIIEKMDMLRNSEDRKTFIKFRSYVCKKIANSYKGESR